MTSSFPNEPLWPRGGRVGSSAPAISSSSLTAPSGTTGVGGASGAVSCLVRAPNPTGRSAIGRLTDRGRRCIAGQGPCPTGLGEVAQPLDPGEDPPLAVVEPLLDVGREEEPATRGPDAVGDGDGIVRLVADRDRDPAHPELLGAGRRPTVE